MQMDFHFYTIYALARAAGFKPDDAHIIAYSSQHTDDAKYDHALEFENGGRFQQVLSAHKFLDPEVFTKATCYRIWVPFHFLPGNLGTDFYERMLARANSIVAQTMVEDFLRTDLKPYSLHRLGIILHVYADTWSHQNFMGIINDINDIKEMEVKATGQDFLESLLGKLKEEVLEYLAPKLGHAQAGTIPDEPYREWDYKDYKGRYFQIFNHERALDAAQQCYTVLFRFAKLFPHFLSEPELPWQKILDDISSLFSRQGELKERTEAWREAISNGKIGFEPKGKDIGLLYDDREWFRDAVTVTKEGEEKQYRRNEGFETSHWKHFHDAAAFHRFNLLHEILPEYGIICG